MTHSASSSGENLEEQLRRMILSSNSTSNAARSPDFAQHPIVRLPPSSTSSDFQQGSVHTGQRLPDAATGFDPELVRHGSQYMPPSSSTTTTTTTTTTTSQVPPSISYSHNHQQRPSNVYAHSRQQSSERQPSNVVFRTSQRRGQRRQIPLDPNAFIRNETGPGQLTQQQQQQYHRGLYDPRNRSLASHMDVNQKNRQVDYIAQIAATIIPPLEMSQVERNEKEILRVTIERILQEVCASEPLRFPQVSLQCFGSFQSGFASAGSDMDLVIVSQDGSHTSASFSLSEDDLPRTLEKNLLDLGFGARLLTRTRVPIIKICERPTEELLSKLRSEREKWDCLPETQKYPPLHTGGEQAGMEKDAPTNPVEDRADGANQDLAQSGTTAKPDDVDPNAETAVLSNRKADSSDKKTNFTSTRRDKPWTRVRNGGELDFPPHGVGIQSDINFFNPLGLHNTRMLRCYSLCDMRVRPMVLFVKAWAKRRQINSSYSGTLSSYGYVLMVLHYLVNVVVPPVLPNLQGPWRPGPQYTPPGATALNIDGWTVDYWAQENEIVDARQRGLMSSNGEPLASLLIGFFNYYASLGGMQQFHWTKECLSLRSPGGILTKDEKGWTKAMTEAGEGKRVQHRYLFCIEDPYELSHNVARTVTHNGIVAIRDEFRRARNIIGAAGSGWRSHEGDLFDEITEKTERDSVHSQNMPTQSMDHAGNQAKPVPGSYDKGRHKFEARNFHETHQPPMRAQKNASRHPPPPMPPPPPPLHPPVDVQLPMHDPDAFPTLGSKTRHTGSSRTGKSRHHNQ